MAKFTSVLVAVVLLASTASGCISVHKKETKEDVSPPVVEHHTVVVP